ncbi:hypothetical protein H5410_063150 [Solanum commersonii]|uniref:Uncharacterized protein n=1 Tax=Solanum commersonii TaxID=4109 RepID=A0A9J5WEG5_SOLCO|nr:hypothetical protein H5410_063150 [Solanum commersonii]
MAQDEGVEVEMVQTHVKRRCTDVPVKRCKRLCIVGIEEVEVGRRRSLERVTVLFCHYYYPIFFIVFIIPSSTMFTLHKPSTQAFTSLPYARDGRGLLISLCEAVTSLYNHAFFI